MSTVKFTVLFTSLLATSTIYGQKYHSFKSLLSNPRVGKVSIHESYNDTTWQTYLGKITSNNKDKFYYVFKEFKKVRAAATWHGHSNLYIFTEQKRLYAIINVEMPHNLPFRLSNNKLSFKYSQNGATQLIISKVPYNLPPVICFGPVGCYDVRLQ